jgi:hypothetical protein
MVMDALTYRVKVKDVLFFVTLAMISLILHAALLFGFNLTFKPLERRVSKKQLMKVDFSRGVSAQRKGIPRTLFSPVPDPETMERPLAKKNRPVAPAQTADEGADVPEEMPEAFSQFLDELDEPEEMSYFEFQGENYDILEGGSFVKSLLEGPDQGAPGLPKGRLDPRVQMVVTRVLRNAGKTPPTFVETGYPHINYPDIQVEKKDYQAGWTSVYILISVDSKGGVEEITRIRPSKPDEVQMVFVDAALQAIDTWEFQEEKSFIHVDVRFYVE